MTTYYVDPVLGNDGNAGTAAGSGNAWATLNKATTTVAASDVVRAKASANYNETLNLTTTAGTDAAPITFEGYTSSPGDGGQVTVDAQNTRANCLVINKNYQIVHNFLFTGATTRCADITAALPNIRFENCSFLKAAGSGNLGWDSSTFNSTGGIFYNCLFDGFATFAFTRATARLFNCRFVNCGPLQTASFSTTPQAFFCQFRGGAGPALDVATNTNSLIVLGCNFRGKTSGSAIRIVGTGHANHLILQNVFALSAAYEIDAPALQSIYADRNAFYNTASGPRSSIAAGPTDITLSADPFTSSTDLSLNTVAGGGALCRAAGLGGFDLGALQHRDPAGSARRGFNGGYNG